MSQLGNGLPSGPAAAAAGLARSMTAGCCRCAVTYGLERLNGEVSAWMRGELQLDGTKPLPPCHVSAPAISNLIS